jgi:RNA polymerase sigma-70 factor (ECF subfamily)
LKIKNKISNFSNEELLENFLQTGETAVFGELYRRYLPLVYGLCLKYLENKEAAHDAVMDIFENIMEKLPHYEVKNFHTWLYSVAKNHCLQVLRKENRIIFVNIEENVVENPDDFTLIEKPQTEEETEALVFCIGTLAEEQQTSIRYFYMEEKSYADIVELTGYALNKVKSYIQNGKRNLKSCILNRIKKWN